MALSLQTFTQWVAQQAAAVQASATALVDFATGSVTRAILEANASVALWMQWIALQVLALTRAATSNGPDLDSWGADFGFTRLPAVAATGQVTFARFSATIAATVPAGTVVQTAAGAPTFTTNAALTLPIGSASGTVGVTATVAGVAGNVLAGTVSVLTTAVSGIDTVTNSGAFTGGMDAESDAAMRARFVLWVNSRAEATVAAVEAAIADVQQGLSYTVQENVTPSGVATPGTFVVTVDDGSGNPPASLLSAVATAVNAVRPVGSVFTVQAPTVLEASVAFTLTAAAGYQKSALIGPAEAAVTAFIDGLGLGVPLPYSRLPQVIYDSAAGIANVTGLTLNGGTADLGGGAGQEVLALSVVGS